MPQQQLSLVHLVREPSTRTEGPPPLLLLLHGIGSYEGDLMALAPYIDGRFFVVSARAPFTLGPGSYGWYRVDSPRTKALLDPEEPGRTRELLLRFAMECVETYRLDPKQVYLMGFSQGAIMSLGSALFRPEQFAGVVAMSGRVLPELMNGTAAPEKLADLPVLVVHGTGDNMLPIQEGRKIRSMLEDLQVRLTYHEYDMGHQVTDESLDEVTRWLTARLDEKGSS